MNELKDNDLREALRRREARRKKSEVPADFMYNVMQSIQEPASSPRPRGRRVWLYAAIAAAASLLLFVVFHNEQPQPGQDAVVAEKPVAPVDSTRQKIQEEMPATEAVKPVVAQIASVKAKQHKRKADISATSEVSTSSSAEDLAYYIARLEAEMENLDDSVSAARVEKLIAADVRLQQLVNRIVSKQVEQAVNELKKDSTAQYINF